MIVNRERLIVGKIVGIHGIKGFMKVHSFTQNTKDILNYSAYFINENEFDCITFHFKVKKLLVCSLPGCNSRSVAENYIGKMIEINISDLPKLGKNEFYHHKLIGFEVKTVKDEVFGNIIQFHDFGGGQVVHVNKFGEDFYLPIDSKFINEIDIEERKVILNLPIDFINTNQS